MARTPRIIAEPTTVSLADFDPADTDGWKKTEAKEEIEKLGAQIDELEDLLVYAGKHGLLILVQGLDTSGKGGAIRTVLRFSNAQGSSVATFKEPTEEELAHDFLWRAHQKAPRRGAITFFDRSHYEDVLVVRVNELVPEEVWHTRYDHINNFERLLSESGIIILKFFLHISKDEQGQRLLAREEEVEKAWKLSVGDWKNREHWDEFVTAYEDVLSRCGTPHAPWHIVAADKKWYRDLYMLQTIHAALEAKRAEWMEALEAIGKPRLAELKAYRAKKGQ